MPRNLGLTALIVAAGLGITACSSSSTATPTPSTGANRNSSATILAAATSSLAQDSADVRMVVSATVGSRRVGITGTGTVDFANSAMQMTMTLRGVPTMVGTLLSTVILDGTTYISYPGIAATLPGKSWISEPTSSSSTSGLQVPNVSDMLRVLAAKGAVVTNMGVGTIGTTPVTDFDVSLSPLVIASQADALGVPSADSAEIRQILGNGGATFRVSVTSVGQFRQLSLHMTVPASSSSPAVHQSVVVDFTNYGTPVSVIAPPATQVATAQQLQEASK
jgi:hypothetical protein